MKSVEISYHYEVPDPLIPRPPADSAAARRRLEEGNRSFAALLDELHAGDTGTARRVVHVDPRDLNLTPAASGPARQHPFAAVLGCSDARVPIELVFNEGPNACSSFASPATAPAAR